MLGKKQLPFMAIFISLCIILAALPAYAYTPDNFSDVPPDHWAYQSIMNMARLGILSGYPDGTFKPDKYVSREEFARILCGATSIPIANPRTNTFADVTQDDWAFRYIETVKDYLTGYPSPTGGKPLFKGKMDATREDVAVALVKIKGFDKTTMPNPTILDDMYKDVESISPSLKNLVAIAVEKKLIAGYPDHTFRGTQPVTRAEAAVLIDKANRIAGDAKDISYFNSASLIYLTADAEKRTGFIGETIQAQAKGIYTNGHTRTVTSEVTWISSNPSILKVDDDGRIRLLAEGSAYIIAILADVKDEFEITVFSPYRSDTSSEIKYIKVSPETSEIKIGDTLDMKAHSVYENGKIKDVTSDVRWDSSDSDIVIISSHGRVVALNEGTVLIKAQYEQAAGYAAISVVRSVYSPPAGNTVTLQSITLSSQYKEMLKGEKISIKAIGNYSDMSKKDITNEVVWSSSNTKVVEVSKNGQLFAKNEGIATITAQIGSLKVKMYVLVRKR